MAPKGKSNTKPTAEEVAKEKEKDQAARPKTVDELQAQLNSEYGTGAIIKLGNSPKADVEVIPSGVLGLDVSLGVG